MMWLYSGRSQIPLSHLPTLRRSPPSKICGRASHLLLPSRFLAFLVFVFQICLWFPTWILTQPTPATQSESIIVAKHYAAKYNYPVSPNRELVALGLANIVGSFVLAMPSFGSLTRSAVSDAAGNFYNQSQPSMFCNLLYVCVRV